MSYVLLIVKGTRLCNLRCTYCNDWRAGPDQTMPFPVLAHMTCKALQDSTHEVVDFIWHGGETTLLPISFYERALLVQARFRRDGQRVRNSIQTNGTRLTPDWVEFLRENEFRVGVSIDGPPEIHDQYRRYVSGRPSFDDVLSGIQLLRDRGVNYGVLMVIDEGAYALGPDRIFQFFVDAGIKRFGLLAARPSNQPAAAPGTPTSPYISPGRFNRFLMRMYDLWEAYGDPTIEIRELDLLRKRLLNTPHKPCTLSGGCIGKYFMVNPMGEVAHCDLFLGDPAYIVGNILRDDFTTIRRSTKLLALQAGNDREVTRLRNCDEFSICNGWCPHERYLSVRHDPDYRDDCCGLRELIGHIRSRMSDEVPGRLPSPHGFSSLLQQQDGSVSRREHATQRRNSN